MTFESHRQQHHDTVLHHVLERYIEKVVLHKKKNLCRAQNCAKYCIFSLMFYLVKICTLWHKVLFCIAQSIFIMMIPLLICRDVLCANVYCTCLFGFCTYLSLFIAHKTLCAHICLCFCTSNIMFYSINLFCVLLQYCTSLFVHGLNSHFCNAFARIALALCALPGCSGLTHQQVKAGEVTLTRQCKESNMKFMLDLLHGFCTDRSIVPI